MAEYIEREALMNDFRNYLMEKCDRNRCVSAESCQACESKCLWYRIIVKAPAADVVEVVRCKDCKYYEHPEYYHYNGGGTKDVCRTFKRQMQADDFCSYGERKDGAE